MWSELLGQKTKPCPPGLLLNLELLHVYFSTCLPFCPYHKEVVELCCEPPGFFDDINHLRSFQKELHFTPDSLPSCAPLSFPQKKMLSSFVLNFKGSVTIQSLEQLSVVHSASYSTMKSGSDNSVLVVHSLCCITPGSVSLVSCLAPVYCFVVFVVLLSLLLLTFTFLFLYKDVHKVKGQSYFDVYYQG